jgi:hypothetical protein
MKKYLYMIASFITFFQSSYGQAREEWKAIIGHRLSDVMVIPMIQLDRSKCDHPHDEEQVILRIATYRLDNSYITHDQLSNDDRHVLVDNRHLQQKHGTLLAILDLQDDSCTHIPLLLIHRVNDRICSVAESEKVDHERIEKQSNVQALDFLENLKNGPHEPPIQKPAPQPKPLTDREIIWGEEI